MKFVPSSQSIYKGAFILTIAALITKVLSAFYRIPFQNIAGDIGFYIYQQVYPIYGIAVVLATTGFPVVISKLLTEYLEKRNEEKARFLLVVCYLFLQLFGFLCFVILYFGAGRIAAWMNDGALAALIRVVSIVYLTFPIVSVLRGYFQGLGDMVPTAFSQVGEQTVRIATILVLSYLFIEKGYSLYLVGSGAMFGSIMGSIISAVILFMFLWIRKEWKRMNLKGTGLTGLMFEARQIIRALLVQGLMVCLSGMLLIFIQLADSLNVYSLLTASGVEQTLAKTLKGIFDRGQPLIQLGTVAATSMSLTIVPLITRERLAGNVLELRGKILLAIKVSIVIGAGASFGLWAIIKPANIMLFENEFGSDILGVLSFVIFFTSIILTMIAIMQGLGSLFFPALAVMSVLPIKYIFNIVFVPLLGTMGAAISSLIALGIVSIVLLHKLKRMAAVPILSFRFLTMVILAVLAMAVFLKAFLCITGLFYNADHIGRFGAGIQALSAVALGGAVYLLVIIRGKVFAEEELSLFPFGSRLLHLISRKEKDNKWEKQ
ncbi:polysaccharide biosynthesis protein [Neobacillus mesonae]|uniref:putative polysaccharide biosynthesis protein n=1 Tax=Neobacillus mesonae TaxID=1193713 RepID=UPI00203AE7D1|nr:polysaccharide biosynthesis protein [Neobacillus mesonae]MCM3570799.1 polysaccharide biosynthesis protein [Neobacillus mesonae]